MSLSREASADMHAAEFPKIDEDLTGNTFSAGKAIAFGNSFLTWLAVLGVNTGPLERFLMKRKLFAQNFAFAILFYTRVFYRMGPSWLEIEMPRTVAQQISWCKVEVCAFMSSPRFSAVRLDVY